jgi:hypothetical protein
MSSIIWGREIAEVYDKTYAAMSEASVLEPMLDLLAELARGAGHSSSRSAPDGWPFR